MFEHFEDRDDRLICLSSLAGHVDHHAGPSLVHSKVHLLPVNVLDGEVMETCRSRCTHREQPQRWPWCKHGSGGADGQGSKPSHLCAQHGSVASPLSCRSESSNKSL